MATTPPGVNQLISAIFSKLNTDGTLTGNLGSYNSNPAIFSGELIPPTTGSPFVSIRPVVSQTDLDDKTNFRMVFGIDIELYSEGRESQSILNTITDRTIVLLHKTSLTLATDSLLQGRLTGRTEAPTEDRLSGTILSFEFIVI